MKLVHYKTTPIFITVWVLMVWFLYQEVESQSFLTKAAKIDINDGALIMRQDHLGFYLGNQKIGFSQFILKEDNEESETKLPGNYYMFNADMFLRIQTMGITQEMRIQQSGEVNEDLSMRTFKMQFDASGQRLYTLGVMQDDGLKITSKSEDSTTEQVVPIEGPIYHTEMIHLLVARDGLEIGNQYTYPTYDPLTMAQGNIQASVDGKEEIELPDGETVEAFKITINFKGLKSTAWINKNGDRYKEVSQVAGIVFSAMREDKEDAINLDFVNKNVANLQDFQGKDPDLIEASRIKSNAQFRNPNAIIEMRAKVIGATKENVVIDDTYQHFVKEDEDGVVIRVTQLKYDDIISELDQSKPPYTSNHENVEEFLKEELMIQSNHPLIKEKSLEVTKNANNQWEAVNQIATWLYRNISKELRATIPSAVEILKTMKGDCNEHSTLLAAMARSIGIPTKIASGLVYQDDGFYYHAWNEVYINGTWLPVDATLNRIKMDAAHIKMAEGSTDAQTEIVNLIGQIDVEVQTYNELQ